MQSPTVTGQSAIVIKCPSSTIAEALRIKLQARAPISLSINSGTEVFVWGSGSANPRGLAKRGFVVKFNRAANCEVTLDVADAAPRRRFGVVELSKQERGDTSTVLGGLAAKLYWHAHDKIAALTVGEADLLRSCFQSPADELARQVVEDLMELSQDLSLARPEREALVQARIGQGSFRATVLLLWGKRCALTGCTVVEALRASHIKPWRSCSRSECLDGNNGLPLLAHLDALFDIGLISFDQDGGLLASPNIPADERSHFGLATKLIGPLNAIQRGYVEYHRQHIFRGS